MSAEVRTEVVRCKEEIERKCDNYVAFAELSSLSVDPELDDLREDLAATIRDFLPHVVSLSADQSAAVIEGVERFANQHKHAIGSMFETMIEMEEEFKMMCTSISGDYSDMFEDMETDSEGSEGDSDSEDDGSAASSSADQNDVEASDMDEDSGSESEDDENDEETSNLDGSGDENSTNYSSSSGSYDEDDDIISDEEMLSEMREMLDPALVEFKNDLLDADIPNELIQKRMDELRRMLVKMADSMVSDATIDCVETRKHECLAEMDSILRMGVMNGMLSEVDSSKDVLETIAEIATLGKDRLDELPFAQYGPIEDAIECIDDAFDSLLTSVQLSFANKSDYEECADKLMDINEEDDEYEPIELTEAEMLEVDRRIAEMGSDESVIDLEEDEEDDEDDEESVDGPSDLQITGRAIEAPKPEPASKAKGKGKAAATAASPKKAAPQKAKAAPKSKAKAASPAPEPKPEVKSSRKRAAPTKEAEAEAAPAPAPKRASRGKK